MREFAVVDASPQKGGKRDHKPDGQKIKDAREGYGSEPSVSIIVVDLE
jgi:hypothetical protein